MIPTKLTVSRSPPIIYILLPDTATTDTTSYMMLIEITSTESLLTPASSHISYLHICDRQYEHLDAEMIHSFKYYNDVYSYIKRQSKKNISLTIYSLLLRDDTYETYGPQIYNCDFTIYLPIQ